MQRKSQDNFAPKAEDMRMKAYLELDRRAGLHPAVKALVSRPEGRTHENTRARAYARIERGQTA
ncbi:hypothetical protein RYZ20_05440 [Thioclava sp. A2]|uniref:hypothetical protein n=1 Tax=Thioclava sp. FCG-A2 TaxID=3080562 RepID=UPI002954D4B0|nr:hypothetical protein [Thioclava sp. A2]MDV7270338.1 hypothetical protein [Thioclava sp. A2]